MFIIPIVKRIKKKSHCSGCVCVYRHSICSTWWNKGYSRKYLIYVLVLNAHRLLHTVLRIRQLFVFVLDFVCVCARMKIKIKKKQQNLYKALFKPPHCVCVHWKKYVLWISNWITCDCYHSFRNSINGISSDGLYWLSNTLFAFAFSFIFRLPFTQ